MIKKRQLEKAGIYRAHIKDRCLYCTSYMMVHEMCRAGVNMKSDFCDLFDDKRVR